MVEITWAVLGITLRLGGTAKILGSQQYVVVDRAEKGEGLQERTVSLSSDGTPSAFSSTSETSCLLNLGCYKPLDGVRPYPAIVPKSADPLTPKLCFSECIKRGHRVAAVHGVYCGCSEDVPQSFREAVNENQCNFNCTGEFTSPICGGDNDHWNLYMCYTYEQIGSLAVDPWRNIAFKTVRVNWNANGLATSRIAESYFLFASDVTSGQPLLQYHRREEDAAGEGQVFSGLSFDVDSSRLIALGTPSAVGRVYTDARFTFKLVVIDIETYVHSNPVVAVSLFPMFTDPVIKQDIFAEGGYEYDATSFLFGSQISGIISRNGIDTYIFSVSYGIVDNNPASAKSKLMFVDLADSSIGQVFYSAPLDCIVTQLAINEYYGDVAILASRQGNVEFIAIATVYRDPMTKSLTVHSYWDPSGVDPMFVAAVSDTRNLNLLAGVSASIPMLNQSCHGIMLYNTLDGAKYADDRQLLLNQPSSASDNRTGAIPSVVCFDIRNQGFFQLWGSYNGTARTVQNGTTQAAVTMNLYQADPGFPLTLPRPEMTSCELSMSGLTVTVKFDSVTLMGATAVDSQNRGVPDSIDYSTQVLLPSPPSFCFSNATVSLLQGATCSFSQSDTLTVTLDRKLSLLTFNDALCIKPNFLCRNQGAQWSSYATGCCTVTLPPSVEAPKPVMTIIPSLTIDVCSDITVDLADSLNCGRGCSYFWNLTAVKDVASVMGVGDLTYGSSVLSQFKNSINQMLVLPNMFGNSSSITLPSSILAKNSYHYFQVVLTSSWRKVTTADFRVEKLSEPAPTVTIQGDQRIVKAQSADYSITAVGKTSSCAASASSGGIGYSWTYSNCSVVLSKLPAIISNQNLLRIPSGTHVCPPNVAWWDSAISKVVCEQCSVSVSVFLLATPQKKSTQSMSVLIVKSPIFARCQNPDSSRVTRGPTLFVNCANSVDLDNPPASSFQGNFDVSCLNSELQPCFPNPEMDPTFTDVQSCVTDYTQPRSVGDGGVLYPLVLFTASQGYCRLGRGVFAVNTNLLPQGSFSFTVDVTHFDNLRTASKQLSVQLTDMPMPKVSLGIVGTLLAEYPVSSGIRIEAVASMDSKAMGVKYIWTLLAKQLNLLYDQDVAQALAVRGQVYTVPQFVFSPVSTLNDCRALNKAQWKDDSPTISISPYCLQAGTQYTIRLNITWVQPINGNPIPLSTYSELLFATASGPPRNGQISISPLGPQYTTCEFAKTFTASDWVSEDTPLTYRFGYIVDPVADPASDTITTVVKYWFTDTPQQARTFTGLIPCGTEQSGFYRTVFVHITSASGESVYAFKRVKSEPPFDIVAASESIITQAQALVQSDPAQAFTQYMTAISLTTNTTTPTRTTATIAKVVESVRKTECSSSDCGDRQLVFLNNLAGAVKSVSTQPLTPEIQESILGAVEKNVDRISLTDTSALAQTQNIFSSIASLVADLSANSISGSSSSSKSGRLTPHHSVALQSVHPDSKRTGPLIAEPTTRLLKETDHRVHHADLLSPDDAATDCQEIYCDKVDIICFREVFAGHHKLICCDEPNTGTGCTDPPCWFYGSKCPYRDSTRRLMETTHRSLGEVSQFSQKLIDMVNLEKGPFADTVLLQEQADRAILEEKAADANFAAYVNTLQPDLQRLLWAERNATYSDQTDEVTAKVINASTLLGRINTARDRIVRKIIQSLVKDQAPLVFETDQFRITIGKTTDMSSVLPAFTFPTRYTVPKNSPDNPTADNPLTGFSFYYTEYFADIYRWSLNRPVSSQSSIVSLQVMKANPDLPLLVSSHDPPIRMFANNDLFASAVCKSWDRLSSFPGGGWSGAGAINDGAGCLVKNWGVIGLFIDGSPVHPRDLGLATTDAQMGGKTGNGEYFLVLAVFFFFEGFLLIMGLWGFRIDTTTTNPPSTIHLDGDGVTTPLTLEDPIAYHLRDERVGFFAFTTFLNVVKRSHVFLGPLVFHPIYMRAHRILAAAILLSTVFGTVSLLNQGFVDSVSVGLVSALIAYPVHHVFRFMLAYRPESSKSISIKRVTATQPIFIRPRIVTDQTVPRSTFPLRSSMLAVEHAPPPAPMTCISGDSPRALNLLPMHTLTSVEREESIPPPPPPDEDPVGFVRRVRDVFVEKAHAQVEERIVRESEPIKAIPIPLWVEKACALIIYSSAAGWILLSAIIVGMKTCYYSTPEIQNAWYLSSVIGLLSAALVLDPLFCAVVTIIEIRKFTARKHKSTERVKRTLPPVPSVSPVHRTLTPIPSLIPQMTLPREPSITKSPPLTPPIVLSREPSMPRSPSLTSSLTPSRVSHAGDSLLPGRIERPRSPVLSPPAPPPRPPSNPPDYRR